jgi:hypothetical protein
VLMIPGADHHRVQFGIGQQLLGILEALGALAEQLLRVIGRSLPVHRPEIAHAAQIEIGVCPGRELQHAPVTVGPVPASELANLNAIVGAHDSRIGKGGQRERRLGRGLNQSSPGDSVVHNLPA